MNSSICSVCGQLNTSCANPIVCLMVEAGLDPGHCYPATNNGSIECMNVGATDELTPRDALTPEAEEKHAATPFDAPTPDTSTDAIVLSVVRDIAALVAEECDAGVGIQYAPTQERDAQTPLIETSGAENEMTREHSTPPPETRGKSAAEIKNSMALLKGVSKTYRHEKNKDRKRINDIEAHCLESKLGTSCRRRSARIRENYVRRKENEAEKVLIRRVVNQTFSKEEDEIEF